MRDVSVREIIEYARNIESESFAFYMAAAEVLSEPLARDTAQELAAEESRHFERLGRLLQDNVLTSASLNQRIQERVDLSGRVVPTMEITAQSTSREILGVALQREERTRDQYRTFLSFSDMDPAAVNLFEDLVDQEEGHARRIYSLLQRLRD